MPRLIGKDAGQVLNTVQTLKNGVAYALTTSWSDVGLSATITPRSATSKILILVNSGLYVSANGGALRILRGSTNIFQGGSQDATGHFQFYFTATAAHLRDQMTFLDSPASTSSLTYKVQGIKYNSGSGVTYNYSDQHNNPATIVLMEIQG